MWAGAVLGGCLLQVLRREGVCMILLAMENNYLFFKSKGDFKRGKLDKDKDEKARYSLLL